MNEDENTRSIQPYILPHDSKPQEGIRVKLLHIFESIVTKFAGQIATLIVVLYFFSYLLIKYTELNSKVDQIDLKIENLLTSKLAEFTKKIETTSNTATNVLSIAVLLQEKVRRMQSLNCSNKSAEALAEYGIFVNSNDLTKIPFELKSNIIREYLRTIAITGDFHKLKKQDAEDMDLLLKEERNCDSYGNFNIALCFAGIGNLDKARRIAVVEAARYKITAPVYGVADSGYENYISLICLCDLIKAKDEKSATQVYKSAVIRNTPSLQPFKRLLTSESYSIILKQESFFDTNVILQIIEDNPYELEFTWVPTTEIVRQSDGKEVTVTVNVGTYKAIFVKKKGKDFSPKAEGGNKENKEELLPQPMPKGENESVSSALMVPQCCQHQ